MGSVYTLFHCIDESGIFPFNEPTYFVQCDWFSESVLILLILITRQRP